MSKLSCRKTKKTILIYHTTAYIIIIKVRARYWSGRKISVKSLRISKIVFTFAEINSFTGYGQKDIGIRNLLHWETVSAAAIATTGNI